MPAISRPLFSLALLSVFFSALPGAAQPPTDLMVEPFAGGVTSPVAMRHAGDGSGRLFVVEQGGIIRLVDSAGTTLTTPFLDISSLVVSGGEQGLLGLAFHPNYASNGFFYVNYTSPDTPLDKTVIARYSVSAGDPNVANPDSDFTILEIDQTAGNHNGGDIHFSPIDGYLYIGMGDGGGWDTAQDLSTLLGKMLRIDVDGGSPYAIPADNPYVGVAGALDEIWASGLRNPWRWSFDRVTGDMLIGDVGEGTWEEMSFGPAGVGGLNFGWPCKEGNADFETQFCTGMETLQAPFYEVNHNTGACSIIGGYVYRGSAIPDLVGYVLFHDWCSGETFFSHQTSPGVWSTNPWNNLPTFSTVGYGEDEAGEIYLNQWDSVSRLESESSAGLVFDDGFESGDLSSWSSSSP